MNYDATLCSDPADNRIIYRRKNGTFKTTKYNRARARFDKCVADKLSSTVDVADSIGSSASDITESIVGGGGDRPVYVPDYAQGGGASGGEEFFSDNAAFSMPLLFGGAAILAFFVWSK